MNKQNQKIMKMTPTDVNKQSAAINYYVLRFKEIFQTQNIAAIPRRLVFLLLGGLLSVIVVFYFVISSNVGDNFNLTGYQLSTLSQYSNYSQHQILSDYLNSMTRLLLEKNPQQIKHQSAIFRAMTQATLQELNPEYKRYIVLFLQDADLLQISTREQHSLLWGANLTGANLQDLNLQYANFQGANLANVDFRGTDLRGVKLESANLENSCYNGLTVFNKSFQPSTAGMKEITTSHQCF